MSFLDTILRTTVRRPARTTPNPATDRLVSRLALYYFDSCLFCLRVRRAMMRLGVDVELRNIHGDRVRYDELVRGGGKKQVPCLRIEHENGGVEWLYESSDIIAWLEAELRAPKAAAT